MRSQVRYPMHGCAALAAVGLLTATAAAQDQTVTVGQGSFLEVMGTTAPEPLPQGGPTPRMADGHPDFSGVWFSGNIGQPQSWSRTPRPRVEEDPIPFQPWAQERIDSMSRTEMQLNSPEVNCMPKGVPGSFVGTGHPFELVALPGRLIQLIEVGNNWRAMRTDRRPHPEYPDPLFNGNSSAWWEGDTLVVDSIAIDERIWVLDNGWFHSDELRIVERIRRPSVNYLEYQFTAEDPKVLTAPWTSAWRTFTLTRDGDELLENYCSNNQDPEELQKLRDQEANQNR